MSDLAADLKNRRLPNWGRYARLNPDRPDDRCLNPVYDQYIPDGADDGWGETSAQTVTVEYDEPAKAEQDDIDEIDAEIMDTWIRQLPNDHRVVIVRHYALRLPVGWQVRDPAIRAICDLMAANRKAVDRMEGRG